MEHVHATEDEVEKFAIQSRGETTHFSIGDWKAIQRKVSTCDHCSDLFERVLSRLSGHRIHVVKPGARGKERVDQVAYEYY